MLGGADWYDHSAPWYGYDEPDPYDPADPAGADPVARVLDWYGPCADVDYYTAIEPPGIGRGECWTCGDEHGLLDRGRDRCLGAGDPDGDAYALLPDRVRRYKSCARGR